MNPSVNTALVTKQLVAYLNAARLLLDLQSTYRAHHSTETAVTKVLADIPMALDHGNISMLVLLDLSATFDTVDHDILLRRLEASYGLGCAVLSWFRSYLKSRTHFDWPQIRFRSDSGSHRDRSSD